MCYKVLRKCLFMLPPEVAHTVALKALKIIPLFSKKQTAGMPVEVMGISFPNCLGLAAGLDKNAEYVDALSALGFGFVEVGTVTPKPQNGNPKPRLFRLPEKNAIINRMGFNGCGLDVFIDNLKKIQSDVIVGVNIGKNLTTPIEKALDDYLTCLVRVYPYAHYITVNLSSPNTPGLRELQHGHYLDNLLQGLKAKQAELDLEYNQYVPLVVKVSPDLTEKEVSEIAEILLENKIDGLIVGNTSLSRVGVTELAYGAEAGGLSGQPILPQATQVQSYFVNALGGAIPIIGLGGIMSGEDAQAKLEAGAKLVQVYTGFVYQGPELIADILAGTAQHNTVQ